jgi:hypothetical protein
MTEAIARTAALSPTSLDAPGGEDRPRRRWGRRALLAGAPAGWMVAAALHPAPSAGRVYADLAPVANRWLGVHLAQLLLTGGLGAALWLVARGRRGVAATVTRIAVPVYVVCFAAFDAVAGIASGLAVRHANTLTGPEQEGAASTAEYLLTNHIAGDLSPLGVISGVALVTAVVAAALTLRSAGAPRVVWVSALGGVLLNFHAAGVLPIVGLVGLAAGLVLADHRGFIT